MVSEAEIERLRVSRPQAQVLRQTDATAIVVVPGVRLPSGWSRSETIVRWLVSPAYPAAQPDCFYADLDLRIGAAMPTNSGIQQLGAEQLLWFSWHLQTPWRPGRDDLVTYLHFIEARFSDVR